MESEKKEKVKRFLADTLMSIAVYDIILQTFLYPKRDQSDSVELLAAERIAIRLLKEAWSELEKFKNKTESEKREIEQIGL